MACGWDSRSRRTLLPSDGLQHSDTTDPGFHRGREETQRTTVRISLRARSLLRAERRIHDDLWCASESDVLDNGHFKRSVELSNIMSTSGKDLSGAVSKRQKGDVETRERIGKRIGSSFSVGSASADDFGPISDPLLDFNPVSGTDERMIWECVVCTLFNKVGYLDSNL